MEPMLACLPFVWVQAQHSVQGLHVLRRCPRIWAIIPPPLTSRVSSLFPFQPFVWTDGIGEAREESHSVLINSPHTQTQTWALGTRGLGQGRSLAAAIGTWCSEIQRQPRPMAMRLPASEMTLIHVFINTFTKMCAYMIHNRNKS